MLAHHLRIALRTLRRHPGYALLNVTGLAVGIACCLFLLLFVQDELRYDRFHEDAESVFRISALPQPDREIASLPAHVAQMLEAEIPSVQAATRFMSGSALMRTDETLIDSDGIAYVDPTVFDVLTHPLVRGNAATALASRDNIVLTESMAERLFGRADPMGQTLTLNDARDVQVTGIVEDVPAASHYTFTALAALRPPEGEIEWGTANFGTYVRTSASGAETFPDQLAGLVTRLEAEGQEPWGLRATPLPDIHLYSDIESDAGARGHLRTVIGFTTVALLILLIGCINYMNLATARAARRAEEVGLRKSLGAVKSQLVAQFYGESAVLTLGGIGLALVIVAAGLPWFNGLSGKALAFSGLFDPAILALMVGIFVLVSVVAGSYPAFHLSGFEPVRALRGGVTSGGGPSRLRQGLVVLQFGISAVLIAGTLVVLSQLRYLQAQDLGFDKEHIVTVPLADQTLRESYPAMQDALAQHPAIVSVGAVNQIPGDLGWMSTLRSGWDLEADGLPAKGMPADASAASGLGLSFVAGGAFPDTSPLPDSIDYQFILNETAARQIGFAPEAAIGQRVSVDGRRGEVRGVVADFHVASFHETIEPLAMWYQPDQVNHLAIRLAPGQTEAGMAHVETVWGQFGSHRPFAFRFLDDVYDELYRSEQRLGEIVTVFAFLAVLVACLGLFGLAAFTAQQRTKEVGVRKVLGATVPNLVALLTKDFVLLVGIAFVVAVPLAWVGMSRWLDGFAYHVPLGPLPFLAAGGLLLVIALLTVSTQALRAATADPIRALRSD